MARDWLKTLWAASYKGVPFFVEMDQEQGSRRIVEHEFPMRDVPFLEDLGEGVRHYVATAYVVGDSADSRASAVMQICATRGPGMLVLPLHGPNLVRCLSFERERKKDRHGYIAHNLRFSREGASSSIASIAMLSNQVFVAADNAALGLAMSFLTSIDFASQPSYVRDAVTDGIEENVSTLDVVRTSAQVDPDVSALQRLAIQALFSDAGSAIDAPPATGTGVFATEAGTQSNSPLVDTVARMVEIARALGDGIKPEEAVAVFEDLAVSSQVVVPEPLYVTTGTVFEATIKRRNSRALRIAALTVYGEAIARMKLRDRQSAATLRANVAEHFEYELLQLQADEIDLARIITAMRDSIIEYLSRAILDLAPVITVSANLTLPSLFWSWRLYSDPLRARELVERNRVIHPSFMPQEFEGLAR